MSLVVLRRRSLSGPADVAARAKPLQLRARERDAGISEEPPVPSDETSRCSLDTVALGKSVRVVRVQGERAFRRRLMEMGMVPGTRVTLVNVAPLGDPIEIEMRHARLSIRRGEAANVVVEP